MWIEKKALWAEDTQTWLWKWYMALLLWIGKYAFFILFFSIFILWWKRFAGERGCVYNYDMCLISICILFFSILYFFYFIYRDINVLSMLNGNWGKIRDGFFRLSRGCWRVFKFKNLFVWWFLIGTSLLLFMWYFCLISSTNCDEFFLRK